MVADTSLTDAQWERLAEMAGVSKELRNIEKLQDPIVKRELSHHRASELYARWVAGRLNQQYKRIRQYNFDWVGILKFELQDLECGGVVFTSKLRRYSVKEEHWDLTTGIVRGYLKRLLGG